MNALQCICRPNSLIIDQFKTFQCYKCGISGHMSCYEYSPSEITKLFCIKCRLKFHEPFYDLTDFPLNPILLPKNQKIHEVFKLNLEKYVVSLKTDRENRQIGIICTKIGSDSRVFSYEWPTN